jgi:hypothetical protein
MRVQILNECQGIVATFRSLANHCGIHRDFMSDAHRTAD